VRPMPTDIAKYSIELFKPGGEGIEEVLDRHADLKTARSICRSSTIASRLSRSTPIMLRRSSRTGKRIQVMS
jgi:hypothetical protein